MTKRVRTLKQKVEFLLTAANTTVTGGMKSKTDTIRSIVEASG